MERGWIALWRKSIDSPVFQNEGLWKVWTWCLMKARHSEGSVPVVTGRGNTEVLLMKGQFIFGRYSAAKELGMPPSTVWDRMQKLQNMGNLDIKSDSHFSIVTIRNWEQYQSSKRAKPTGNRQATDTNNNVKNVEKEIYQQAEAIYAAYPRKADRKNSIKSIVKLLKAEVPADTLLEAVKNYKNEIDRKATERDYIIQSNNFFGRAARWEEWRDGRLEEAENSEPRGRAYRPFKDDL